MATIAAVASDLIPLPAKGAFRSFVKDTVLNRISNWRAHAFLDNLYEQYRKEQDIRGSSGDLTTLLKKVEDSEALQEAIFSAFRRVAFSASRVKLQWEESVYSVLENFLH